MPAGATPRRMTKAQPSNPVTGIGTASVIHQVTTSSRTAARRLAATDKAAGGKTRRHRANNGPSHKPTVLRHKPKEEYRSCILLLYVYLDLFGLGTFFFGQRYLKDTVFVSRVHLGSIDV